MYGGIFFWLLDTSGLSFGFIYYMPMQKKGLTNV